MPTALYGSSTAKRLASSNQRRIDHDAFTLGHQIVRQDKAEANWNTPPPYYPPSKTPELQAFLTLGQAIRKERKLPDAQKDVIRSLGQQRLKMRTNMGWTKKPRIVSKMSLAEVDEAYFLSSHNASDAGQDHLDREARQNVKGINEVSDGWTEAHSRAEKSGKITLIKAYRTPYAVRAQNYAKAQRRMLIRRNPSDAMAA